MNDGVNRLVQVDVKPLDNFDGLDLPKPETEGSAGIDICAAVPDAQPVILKPGDRAKIPTGLSIALPQNFEMQVRPRSGLALHHGVTCLNSPATIDSDYRGELMVILINHGNEDFVVSRGDRIAQILVAPVHVIEWNRVSSLPETNRGTDGFGSTGS